MIVAVLADKRENEAPELFASLVTEARQISWSGTFALGGDEDCFSLAIHIERGLLSSWNPPIINCRLAWE